MSKQSSLVENTNGSFSMTLAEEICQKLEKHSRLMNNKRGSSFDDAPSPSPSPSPSIFQRQSSQSSHSEISKHSGIGSSPKYTKNEDPWQKMNLENSSKKLGSIATVPKSILKEEKGRGNKQMTKTFNPDSSGELKLTNLKIRYLIITWSQDISHLIVSFCKRIKQPTTASKVSLVLQIVDIWQRS